MDRDELFALLDIESAASLNTLRTSRTFCGERLRHQ